MRKFSTSTLQKQKQTADDVCQAVSELKNALRVFSQLSAVTNQHSHGFYEKEIEMHDDSCKHILDADKVHREAAECEEQQNCQKVEFARQLILAEEARHKAEEVHKLQMERRQHEEMLRRVRQQEEYHERVKELWKGKNKNKGDEDDEEDLSLVVPESKKPSKK